MIMRQQTLMALKEARSPNTMETVPLIPVPVSLVRADATHDTKSDGSTVSDGVRLNATSTSEEDDIESTSIFIKSQPCILRCTSAPTEEELTWELQGKDPVQDAFYYQSSEILADAKSLGAEVVRDSHLMGQDGAPLQMSCSLISYAMSTGAVPSEPSQPSKKTIILESPTCDVASNLPEDEALSPKTRQNIVNISVHNLITDSFEKSIKDVIKTTILKKITPNGKTQQSIPCAPQTRTASTPDVNFASCKNTPPDHLKDADSNIKTSLVQAVGQTGQQFVSEKQAFLTSASEEVSTSASEEVSTSASEEVLPLWQTQEIVTMSVQDMTDSPEATAECVQSVSISSESPDEEVSKQSSPECDQTTQFTVTLPLENSLLWQTAETMECISKEVQEVLPVYATFNPTSPLPTPETCVPEKNIISCTDPAAIKEVVAASRAYGTLTPVVPQEIPVTHTRFSQEPVLTASNSPSHQTHSETFISSVACNLSCPDKRKLLDNNNNFGEPPQKQFCLNSRVAASISHPVLFQELTVPPLVQGQPQGSTPPILPHFVQQWDTSPVLRSQLQPGDDFSNTVHTRPNYCPTSANAPWCNAPNPNINFPGLPISPPLKSNCQLSGLEKGCIQVNNSAYTWPEYSPCTQEGPKMSVHPQISGESQVTSVFPCLAKRPEVSHQPPISPVMTNTPLLTPIGSLPCPLPDTHLPAYNFSRVPTRMQPRERSTSQLPPLSYFSSLRQVYDPIKELQHCASLASDSSSNFPQEKFRASAGVDRNQILQCIRRPPPPYQARQVRPNCQDPYAITRLPRRAPADYDQWRADGLLQPSPHTVSASVPNRETQLYTRQASSLENNNNVSCLNCAVTIPTEDWCRVLRLDVVAVLKNAIDLSLPPTAEKPSMTLCKYCEEVMNTICSSQQALTLAKERFISSSSPDGYLKKKTYSTIEQHFCVNCNVMITSRAKRRLLFHRKNNKWVVANFIQTEFNVSLGPEKKHKKLYLCCFCYNMIKRIRSARLLMSMAMKDFNLRTSPASHMFMFNQRFQGSGFLP